MKKFAVPLISQVTSLTCWVASAKMVLAAAGKSGDILSFNSELKEMEINNKPLDLDTTRTIKGLWQSFIAAEPDKVKVEHTTDSAAAREQLRQIGFADAPGQPSKFDPSWFERNLPNLGPLLIGHSWKGYGHASVITGIDDHGNILINDPEATKPPQVYLKTVDQLNAALEMSPMFFPFQWLALCEGLPEDIKKRFR